MTILSLRIGMRSSGKSPTRNFVATAAKSTDADARSILRRILQPSSAQNHCSSALEYAFRKAALVILRDGIVVTHTANHGDTMRSVASPWRRWSILLARR